MRYFQIIKESKTDTADVFPVEKTTKKVGVRSLYVIQLQRRPDRCTQRLKCNKQGTPVLFGGYKTRNNLRLNYLEALKEKER